VTVTSPPESTPAVGLSSLERLPLVLTVSEAAVVLRVSRTTAYKLAEEWRTSGGKSGLPVIRLGRRLVVRRVDLAALVEGPASAAS
jgi:excisionase family DNA binding protein